MGKKKKNDVEVVFNLDDNQKIIELFDEMTLKDIDDYGNDTMMRTTMRIDNILAETKTMELGEVGDSLNKLSLYANKQTKRLVNNFALSNKILQFFGRYEDAESKLNVLEQSVVSHAVKLDSTLETLMENYKLLKNQCDEFDIQVGELQVYKDYLDGKEDVDEFRLQSINLRLQKTLSFRSVAKTSLEQTKIQVMQNREYSNQLKDTIDTVIPVFKMQMVGVLANRMNRESEELIAALRKAGNDIIVLNSKEIERSADNLIKNRNTKIIGDEALIEANRTLETTIVKLQEQAKLGNRQSQVLIDTLMETSKRMDTLGDKLNIEE